MNPLNRVTERAKTFLCVEADGGVRCNEQCWQCKNIEEFEECGQPPEDDGEDTNVVDSDAR